jgi:hypothetical protein
MKGCQMRLKVVVIIEIKKTAASLNSIHQILLPEAGGSLLTTRYWQPPAWLQPTHAVMLSALQAGCQHLAVKMVANTEPKLSPPSGQVRQTK